jgi:hypothetical protein
MDREAKAVAGASADQALQALPAIIKMDARQQFELLEEFFLTALLVYRDAKRGDFPPEQELTLTPAK